MSVYVTGDTHAYVDIRKLYSRNWVEGQRLSDNDTLIICGDFGLPWNGSKTEIQLLDWYDKNPYITLAVPGNHDCYDMIRKFPIVDFKGSKAYQLSKKVFMAIRGNVYVIDEKKFFCFGGAASHDMWCRHHNGTKFIIEDSKKSDIVEIRNYIMQSYHSNPKLVENNWWKDEMPNKKDFDNGISNLEKYDYKVDYIITHCAPDSIQDRMSYGRYDHDELTNYFEHVVKYKTSFSSWFFGHYHIDSKEFEDEKGQKYICNYNRIMRIL